MATASQIWAIIQRIAPHAQKYSKKYGYHVASPCIAQALQESLGKYEGLSLLAYKYHNYHGIKNYPKWHGKLVNMGTGEEYTKGVITPKKADFCVFDSEEQGIEEYFLFLERNPRYRNLKACTTAESYLQTIKADGYASDFDYFQNCIKKVYTYNLKQYDDTGIMHVSQPTTYQIGQTYTLDANLYIRQEPAGEKVKFECITQDAKNHSRFDDYGNAVLQKGTRVSCLYVKELIDSIWMLIPSGWICAKEGKETYVI